MPRFFTELTRSRRQLREDKHNIDNWIPDGLVSDIAEGAYYLAKNDEHHRRTYVVRGQEKEA